MPNKFSRRDFLKMGGTAAAGAGLAGVLGRAPRTFAAPNRQDLPRLQYIIRGQAQQDVDLVQQAMSEIMADRIGATVELRFIEPGVYNDQMALINAAAEEYDLVFTAPWTNNYYQNVNQEYLLPMDDLLTELAPGLYASMTPATWEAARVQGSIYGSINQQIFVKPFGPAFHADVVAELGLQEAINSVTSYGDLTPIMVALQEYVESNDQFSHVTGTLFIMHAENFGYDPQDSQTSMLVVASDDPSAQVVIFSETDAFREAAELTREWYLAGYAPTDLLAPDEIDRGWSAGQYAMRGMAGVVKPGGDAENLARWGVPTVSHAIAEPLLTTAGTTATLTGISSTTRQPELAMQYLELINTDPEFYNLLCKGIEGTHWEWEDESRLLIRPAGGAENFSEVGWNPNTDWMFGNVFNSYYSSEAQVGAWPETAELNRGARPSPVLGFTFNRTPVELELASLSAVTAELFEPIVNGLVDPAEAIPAFNQSLRDAGIERVRDEMQAQIEAWLAANA